MKFLLAALLLVPTAYAGTTWENTEGKRITATFARMVDDVVFLERDGRLYNVPLNQLSKDSREYALEMHGAVNALLNSADADREYPERIVVGLMDANPKLLEGRSLQMRGRIAQFEEQGNLRGQTVGVILQSGLRAEKDFSQEMSGGDFTLRVEGGRVMLLQAPSPSNLFPSVDLLMEVGEPLVVRTRVERGELLVLNDLPKEELNIPAPVQQTLAVYQRPEQVFRPDPSQEEMGGVSADDALQYGSQMASEGSIGEGELDLQQRVGGTLSVAKQSGIRYNGRSQVQLADGRYVDAESPEAASEIQITEDGDMMATQETVPAVSPSTLKPRRIDLVYTGITFNGQRQVKLPDGRIMGEDEAMQLQASQQLGEGARLVRSELPDSSVVVKDETGYRIKLSGGGYAALESPEGQVQLARDRERDLIHYQIGGRTGVVQVSGSM